MRVWYHGGMNATALWEPQPLDASPRRWAAGSLRVWAKRAGPELLLAHTYVADGAPEPAAPGAERWTRWGLPRDSDTARLVPRMPDRPFLVRPASPFNLLPGARARVFVRIPVFVGVEAGVPVTELQSRRLSETWFGDFFDGELCYTLDAPLFRDLPRVEPHHALCPVRILNRADHALTLDKFCLRAQHLTLFRAEDGMWTDEVIVSFQGKAEGSETHFTGRTPPEARRGVLVAEPRQAADRGIAARTFYTLLDFMGFE